VKIEEKLKDFTTQLQSLSQIKKWIIFGIVMAVSIVIAIFIEFQITKNNFSKLQQSLQPSTPAKNDTVPQNESVLVSEENDTTQNISTEMNQVPDDSSIDSEMDYLDQDINNF